MAERGRYCPHIAARWWLCQISAAFGPPGHCVCSFLVEFQRLSTLGVLLGRGSILRTNRRVCGLHGQITTKKLLQIHWRTDPYSHRPIFLGVAAGLGLGCGWLWPDLGCIRSSWALRMLILSGISAAIHSRCPPFLRSCFTHESPRLWSLTDEPRR